MKNEITKYNRIGVYEKIDNVYHLNVHKKFVSPKNTAQLIDPQVEELLNSIFNCRRDNYEID